MKTGWSGWKAKLNQITQEKISTSFGLTLPPLQRLKDLRNYVLKYERRAEKFGLNLTFRKLINGISPILYEIVGETSGNSDKLYFGSFKITADGDYCEIKRRKAHLMT